MAKKIGNVRSAAAAAAERDELANELEVLHPERFVQLGARKVEVREYGHVEWLLMLAQWEPLIAAIAEQLRTGGQISYEMALGVIAHHIEPLLPLICQASGLTPDELRALNPDDGEKVMAAWWEVNGRFFVLRAFNRVQFELREAAARRQALASVTAGSTPASSPTGTTSTESADTPSGS